MHKARSIPHDAMLHSVEYLRVKQAAHAKNTNDIHNPSSGVLNFLIWHLQNLVSTSRLYARLWCLFDSC